MFKRKDVIFILSLTFITVVAWVGFNIYHISVTSTIEEELQLQITPIDPNFDTTTIEKLKSRARIEPLYQYRDTGDGEASSTSAEITPEPEPEPEPPVVEELPTPTESIEPTPEPVISQPEENEPEVIIF